MWKTSFQTEWHFKTIPLFWFFSKSLGRLLERRCIECCSKPLITNHHSTTPTKPSIDTGVRPLGSDSYHERDAFFRSHLSSLPFRLIQLPQTVKLPWAPKPTILTVKHSPISSVSTRYSIHSIFTLWTAQKPCTWQFHPRFLNWEFQTPAKPEIRHSDRTKSIATCPPGEALYGAHHAIAVTWNLHFLMLIFEIEKMEIGSKASQTPDFRPNPCTTRNRRCFSSCISF